MYKLFQNTLFLGKEVVHLPTCQSTNDIASDLLARGHAEGLLVITDSQTAGRGQRGHSWDTQPGQNLTCSILFRPQFVPLTQQFTLHLFVSLALYDWAEHLGVTRPQIKWPNDLYADDEKLGGILIENTVKGSKLEGSVVGIGININQTAFGHLRATSLTLHTGQRHQLPEVLETLLFKLEKRYLQLKRGHLNQLWNDYHQRLLGLDEDRVFRTSGQSWRGTIKEVNAHGQLCIHKTDGQKESFAHGEIEWVFENQKG